jgi:Planctomycete cytochrome C/WD domain, G-beta repeat
MRKYVPVLLFALALAPAAAQTGKHPNYDDDVKPVFARYCFQCHSASEMRSGLSLESFAGVLKGGGGEVVIPGRPASSVLYKAVAHEGEGVPQMPLGGAKIPDQYINLIRDWIQQGLLETAISQPLGNVGPSLDFKPTGLNRPVGPPAMPTTLAPVKSPETARANPVTALAASPWAPLLAVSGHERIDLYDLDKRMGIGELAFPEGIPYALHFSRDGATLLAAGGKGVQSGKAVLFDVKTGNRIATIGEERDIVLAADVTADGKLVALGGPGKLVKVYSLSDGKLLYQLNRHTDWITAIEFSPDGTKLATGDRSGGIFLWESASGGTVGNLAEHKDSITSLSWRGDSALLASGSEDGQIIIWNVGDGFPVASIPKAHQPKPAPGTFGTPPGGVLSVQFTADGRLVSVGRDSTIRVWGMDGKQKAAAKPADALLTKVASYGNLTVAGDFQGHIIIWDGAAQSTLPAASAIVPIKTNPSSPPRVQ